MASHPWVVPAPNHTDEPCPAPDLGGALGELVRLVVPAHATAPGAYALVGMAALCAATTPAPLMAAVLVFELSGDYAIVLPLLVATGAATLVSCRIRPSSVYKDELARRGIAREMTRQGRELRGRPGRAHPPRRVLLGRDRELDARPEARARRRLRPLAR